MPDDIAASPTSGASARTILLTVVGITMLLAVVLIAFALPTARTGVHEVPVAVVGAPSDVERLKGQEAGLHLSTFESEPEARDAILSRDVNGAIIVRSDGAIDTLVASAASTSVATLVEQVGSSAAI